MGYVKRNQKFRERLTFHYTFKKQMCAYSSSLDSSELSMDRTEGLEDRAVTFRSSIRTCSIININMTIGSQRKETQ